jgi:hypothetical protein
MRVGHEGADEVGGEGFDEALADVEGSHDGEHCAREHQTTTPGHLRRRFAVESRQPSDDRTALPRGATVDNLRRIREPVPSGDEHGR